MFGNLFEVKIGIKKIQIAKYLAVSQLSQSVKDSVQHAEQDADTLAEVRKIIIREITIRELSVLVRGYAEVQRYGAG